jgi:hypothetical protein
MDERKRRLIYENPLSNPSDISGFLLEGQAVTEFPSGRLRMRNGLSDDLGQKSNFVLWCPEVFPENLRVTWDFWPLREPGLCILFFCAAGHGGEDLFSPLLAARSGEYHQYHSGDIDAYHISYFRRKELEEQAFHLCNLRKSKGFHMVAQGADPLPPVVQAIPPYHIALEKDQNAVRFFINGLPILTFEDDGKTYGPVLGKGRIGFRQMAPLEAEYANLRVYELA